MSFSKPISDFLVNIIGNYLQALYERPIRTKALTSCVIATLGNVTSQVVAGSRSINYDSIIAFGLFGLLFGGAVPHYFYTTLEKAVPKSSSNVSVKKFIIERFLFAPFYQILSLYMLARFEGKNHDEALKQLEKLFWKILQANWKYLSILTYLNLTLVPPPLRVLVVNLIGFFWSIFLASKRRQEEERRIH